MSKAVIFFAPGLEECEGLLCVDLLRRSGVEVTIAAVGGEKIVKSARSISVVADALAEELDYSAFDAAILPGGIPTRFIETVVSLIVSSLVFQGKTEIIDRFSVVWIRITFL